MKTVFITGVPGYLGAHLAQAFQEAGYAVSGLVHRKKQAAELEALGIRPVVGHLGNPRAYARAAAQAETLVHAALDRRNNTARLDQRCVKTLLKRAAGHTPPRVVLYTSSLWVFGDSHGALIDADTPRDPIKAVSWRPKIEDLVLQAEGSRGVVLRPGILYGGGDGLTRQFFAGAAQGRLRVVGDGSNHWAMVHAADAARAYVLAAQNAPAGSAYNLSDGTQYSVGQLARAAAEAMGYQGSLELWPVRDAAIRLGLRAEALALDQRVDTHRARTELGWAPQEPDFVQGINRYAEAWHVNQAEIMA
jgi:nucleoside-diphosphate-sugar epimerase